MGGLGARLMEEVCGYAEGMPLAASRLGHLGSRRKVRRELAALAREGRLLRICRGVYVLPVGTRFGVRPPSVARVLAGLGALTGERFTPHPAAVANALELTRQVPVRLVWLTTGPTRCLWLGAQVVELRHA